LADRVVTKEGYQEYLEGLEVVRGWKQAAETAEQRAGEDAQARAALERELESTRKQVEALRGNGAVAAALRGQLAASRAEVEAARREQVALKARVAELERERQPRAAATGQPVVSHVLGTLCYIPHSPAFRLMKTPVTDGMWAGLVPDTQGMRGKNHPRVDVSWFDAVIFANLASVADGLQPFYRIPDTWAIGAHIQDEMASRVVLDFDADGYRLPTDAEWEFAGKGGEDFEYAGSDDCAAVAWTSERGLAGPQPVGRLDPNGYGLYDMSGNVWEWCQDQVGADRVYRGGSWYDTPWFARVADRYRGAPGDRSSYLGLRLARSIP